MVALVWAARLLALIGFLDATYLTITHFTSAGLACGPGGGCDVVTTSRFAMIGPLPISAIGVGYYAVVSLLVWTSASDWSWGMTRALLGITGCALAVSAALFYLQAAVLHAWCRYCLLSAGITAALFLVAVLLSRRQAEDRVATA